MKHIVSETRGAAMVFGLFFAVFLVGMVWYLIGLSETLQFRQHIQDAADAGAYSAAVVNARGMNLIALINMTMAAVLSVLVGLRLAETLGLVAIGICMGLAWITGGASMVPVPTLTNATRVVHKAAQKVEKVMPSLLAPLHMAGKAISVVVPVGANLRVISTVASEYQVAGFAIPSRFTLPIEDDDFGVLCEHAGGLASEVALFPLSPILPDTVEEKISGATGKLARAGSSWFCGGQGDPPDFNDDEDTRVIEYPIMPRQKKCNDLIEKAQKAENTSDQEQAEIERVCGESGVEYLASLPNRRGQCRRSQPLCPTDCEEDPRASCPPDYFKDCSQEEADAFAARAPEVIGSELITCGATKENGRFDYTQTSRLTSYERRLIAAREQCDPTRPENKYKRGYGWLERSVVFTYQWDAKHGWMRDETQTEYGEQALVLHKNDDNTRPCENLEQATDYESKDMRLVVCQGDRVCKTDAYGSGLGIGGPCSWRAPEPGKPLVMREQIRQVTDIVRCAEEQDLTKVAVERMDVTQSLKDNKQKGGKNTSPFRLEQGVWLGGSDFQLRAVVVGGDIPKSSEKVIELASWSQGRGASTAAEQVANASEVVASMGKVGLAQAEYYFDWTGLDPKPNDQLKNADVTEWLWHMAWRARLRPFRFNHSKADGPRSKEEAGPDAEQATFIPDELKDRKPDVLECEEFSGCDDAQQVIDVFGDGES